MRRILLALVLMLGATAAILAQGGPFPAQIQAALRAFVASNQTITGVWTFSTPCVGCGQNPGGLDTQVQFKDGSAFGGDSGLTFNKTSNILTSQSIAVRDFTVANTYGIDVSSAIDNVQGISVAVGNGGYASGMVITVNGTGDALDAQSSGGYSGWFQSNSSANALPTLVTQRNGASTANLFEAQAANGSRQFTVDATGNAIFADGRALQTDTTTAHTACFASVYDVDGPAYVCGILGTNGNTPTLNLTAPSGGTLGVAATTLSQGGFAISLANTFTTSGANALTLTTTGATNVTLPTSGTLLAAGGALSGTLTGNFISSGSGLAVANVGANSCGTTAATIAGNYNSFEVTVGATAGTQCRVTLPLTAPTRWNCVADNSTTAALARTTAIDTTHVDLLGAFTAGDVVEVVCTPR